MLRERTQFRWWDWASALLYLTAVITSVTRLYATHWTGYLERVQYLALLGCIAGTALGASRFSPRAVKWFAFAYSLFAIPWQLGETITSGMGWSTRLWVLSTRMGNAAGDLLHRRVVHDPILFLTLMALLFWLAALIGGYYLVRYGQVWPAILPPGIALIVIDHYDPGQPTWGRYLGIFLFVSLLLLGRITYLRYRAEWHASGIQQTPGTGMDIGRAALMAVVVLVLFAWTFPVIGQTLSPASQLWVRVSHPFDSIRSSLSDAFSSLRSSIGFVSEFYGGTMALGTGTRLGDQVVFSVRTTTLPLSGNRYYWRARSYDIYQDGNWSTSVKSTKPIPANALVIAYPPWKDREKAQFTFLFSTNMLGTIYTPTAPLQVSRAGSATLATNPDGSTDVEVLSAVTPIVSGDSYIVTSWIANAPTGDLAATGWEYPGWIKDRYLQLPAGLSPRFAELAKSITGGLKDPYSQAEAVTQYLRRTITYSQAIDTPPAGVDPIEWFLFTYKKGYCNYYATAEVLLLRSLGIPARLAVGFAEGTANGVQAGLPGEGQIADSFTVRYKDSHAWPEVYFNDIGWIEFEPTVSQPNLVRPGGGGGADILSGRNTNTLFGNINGINDASPTAAQSAGRFITSRGGSAAAVAVSTLALAGLAFLALRRSRGQVRLPVFPVWLESAFSRRGWQIPDWLKRWSRWSLLTVLERAYGAINQGLSLAGRPAHPSDTPAERARSLSTLIPAAAEPASYVVEEYQHAKYSQQEREAGEAGDASRQIRAAAWKAFFTRLVRRR